MDCKHVNDHLIDYLYQELAPDQMDRIEGHIKGCEGCTAELEAFESTRSAMRSLPELEPPPALTQILMREATRAVQPAPEASFWERLREGLRMMVMHPAMTAAVLLVVVVGISFVVYRHGGPPSLEPRADDLPPVPPATVTTEIIRGAPAGATAEEAARPERLKEEERTAGDEAGRLKVADNNKQAELSQAVGGESELRAEGKTSATRELNKAAAAPGPTPVAAAEPKPEPRDYKDQPQADKLDDLIDGAVGGRARRRPAARRPAPDPGYRGKAGLAKAEPAAKSPAPRRALGNLNDDEDALSGGDFWGQKKKGLGSLSSGTGAGAADRSSAGGAKYAKAPPPVAKPRPQVATRYKSAPSATPAPEAVQAQAAPSTPSTSTPTPQQPNAPKGTSAPNAAHWAALGDAASNAGRCEQALAYYNRALALQPGLRKRVAGRVDRCVKVLGQDGEARLARGAKEYPALAGWFSAEVSRQRQARANDEAGAPYTGKVRASKRKAKPAKKAQQAPTSK